MSEDQKPPEQKSPLRDIVQPFIDLIHAPRALWGVNLPYFIEGFAYWGVLTYLAMYFNEYVGLDDIAAGWMVGIMTAGITISMFFFGGLADKFGVRPIMIAAFVLLVLGRALLPLGSWIGLQANGLGSPVHLVAMGGILLVLLGYGMYQPAAYAAVKQFTTPKTAGMAFAMLYALQNLGGWLPSFMTGIRERLGIPGALGFYIGATILALICTILILTRKTVRSAIASAKAARVPTEARQPETEKARDKGEESSLDGIVQATQHAAEHVRLPLAFWLVVWVVLLCAVFILPRFLPPLGTTIVRIAVPTMVALYWVIPSRWRNATRRWLRAHPMADAKFAFFIFALIPVQTLFAHNWLTFPMYVSRAYSTSWPWISTNFEKATNFNPLLIFILVPIVTAMTQKRKVYNMMILGTFIMAAPTFLLALGPTPWTLIAYLLIMTTGEAMWQPRFLQYAAEIAPEGRTGAYMGVAQFPWFLTKVIVPIYSGWFLKNYCPEEGVTHTETMWLIYACIAMVSTVVLMIAKPWVGKDFKTKAT